jgi:hypothetical protein
MRIKNHVLNVSEEIVLKELSSILGENSLRVFPKLRVSDVLEKGIYLDQDYFSLYTRSHFDFLITSRDAKPFMGVEFDGPFHNNQQQNARDEKRTQSLLPRRTLSRFMLQSMQLTVFGTKPKRRSRRLKTVPERLGNKNRAGP